MSDVQTNTELNDDALIDVTLQNGDWQVVVEWFSHTPYQQARDMLQQLNTQIQAVQDKQAQQFTARMKIHEFNTMIFALGQAPYYMVAAIIQSIYQQGQNQIELLRQQVIQQQVDNNPATQNTEIQQSCKPTKPKSKRQRKE